MFRKLAYPITALIIFLQSSSYGVSINDFRKFGTDVVFPESSACAIVTPAGAPNLSADGYCNVGSAVYTITQDDPNLLSGSYYVFFYKNSETNGTAAYFISIGDSRLNAGMVADGDSSHTSFQGSMPLPTALSGGLQDFVNSPQGQGILNGLAQGFAQALQYSEQTNNIKQSELRGFSVSGSQQVQILMQINEDAAKNASSLAQALLSSLVSNGSSGGVVSGVHLDDSLSQNYRKDALDFYATARWEDFLRIQSIPGYPFGSVKSWQQSENFDRQGKSKIFGISSKELAKSSQFLKSLNSLSIIPQQDVQRRDPLKRGWLQAQKFFHIAGVIHQQEDRVDLANSDFAISEEMLNLSGNLKLTAKLKVDGTGRIIPDAQSDFRRSYFSGSLQKSAIDQALNSAGTGKDSLNLSQDAYRRLDQFATVSGRLQGVFPQAYAKWNDFVSLSKKLMDQAHVQLSAGQVETSMMLGEMSLNALDVMSYFTPVGSAEALLDLSSGKNIRTGASLTKSEIIFNALQLIPSKWIVGAGEMTAGTLRKVIQELNPEVASVLAANEANLDKISSVIPESLAAHRDRLSAAIADIKRLTPPGEDWMEKAQEILSAFSSVENFDIESLHEIIDHRQILIDMRNGYNEEVNLIREYKAQAVAEGKDLKEIAKTAYTMRREVGAKYKDMTPEVLRQKIYGRNLVKYKDELGPTFDSLVSKGVTKGLPLDTIYSNIIDSSQETNKPLNDLLSIMERLSK